MHYRNSEMKIDQLIGYFNDGKINLIPPFQRGHVWTLPLRRKLMMNMINGLPIPAIFLYKEASGSKYSYNILDGKQRLESLILFVGNNRADVSIANVTKYFIHERERRSANFWIMLEENKKVTFADLPEEMVRDFREYAIPTIEISLTDESSLDEIISLFIDINQQGVEVNRFDIVKAMGEKNPLLRSVFDLVAEEQKRGEDVFYRKKNNEFTKVLERLEIIQNLSSPNSKVDREWERLLEIAVFCRTGKHRPPVQILKSFIRSEEDRSKLTMPEIKRLRACFRFVRDRYRSSDLGMTRFAADQTHFYTMITSLLSSNYLVHAPDGTPPDTDALGQKLLAFARIIDGKARPPHDRRINTYIKEYQELSRRQTTDVVRRERRQKLFLDILAAISSTTPVTVNSVVPVG